MFDRVTEDAHRAITLAQEEARRLYHYQVGTEHLVLGLLRHEGTFAARALSSLGLTLIGFREYIEATIDGSCKRQPVRQLRQDRQGDSTSPLMGILGHARREATVFGHAHVGTPHLLLGLLDEPDGAAVGVLSDLGVEPADVRRKVLEMFRSGEYQQRETPGRRDALGGGPRGTLVRLEALGDEDLARELEELLILTGIVEIPDESSSPKGLPSGERNEPLGASLDPELVSRIERAARELDERIRLMQDDLDGLTTARAKLAELLESR